MAPCGPDDTELQFARGDALDDRLGVEHPQRDVQLRVELLELAEKLGDHDPAGTGRGADLEHPGKLVATLEPDLGDDLLLECEQPLCAAVEAHSRLGRLDATAGPVEELRPEPLLERPHLEAHRGLGDAEPLGGLREAAPLDDRAEGGELTRVHKGILCTSARVREASLRSPVAARLEDTLISGYTRLAAETPRRRIDVELRLLDVLFAGLFGLLLLPAIAVIAIATLASDGRPVFYRGERVGRHGTLLHDHQVPHTAARRRGTARPVPRRRARAADRGRVHAPRPLAEGVAARRDPAALECSSGRHVAWWARGRSGRGSSPSLQAICPRTGNGLSFAPVSPGSLRCDVATRRRWQRSSRTTWNGSPTVRCCSTCERSSRPAGVFSGRRSDAN